MPIQGARVIPSALVLLVLAGAAFRVTRLIGWDTFPLAERIRAWAVGAKLHSSGSSNSVGGLTDEPPKLVWIYKRPTLHHFLGCPFCQGFWVSVLVYVAWVFEPTGTLYAAVPFAISGAVGLIAKNLDP